MQPLARLHGRVGKIDHICTDETCPCHKDESIKKMRGKWIVQLDMLTPKGEPLKEPLICGPFETEAEANQALKNIAKDAEGILSQQGVTLRDKTPKRSPHGSFTRKRETTIDCKHDLFEEDAPYAPIYCEECKP